MPVHTFNLVPLLCSYLLATQASSLEFEFELFRTSASAATLLGQ